MKGGLSVRNIQLKNITVGAAIPNIGVDKLKKVKIPLPQLGEQQCIARKYRAVQEEILGLRQRLESAEERLHHVWKMGSEKLHFQG